MFKSNKNYHIYMPANLPIEYYKLEEELASTKSSEGKIKILEEMLSIIPQHKASQSVRGNIRRKISILKRGIEHEAKRKRSSRRRGIKKEGSAQVCLVGLPNSGKSYVMNKLCNKKIPSTKLPFETAKPEVGMLNINGVQIQLIEIQSLYPGFYEKAGEARGIIHTSDLLCFLITDRKDIEIIKSEVGTEKPFIIASSKDLESLKKKIWKKLNLIRVYTKEPGKKPQKKPVALKEGATIKDVGSRIHKDFLKKFKFAKVYRKRDKVKKRKVGLNFKLKDEDIVEFHTS